MDLKKRYYYKEPESRQTSSSPPQPQPQEIKSRSIKQQPIVEHGKQKKSWLSGLFQDKKNKVKTVKKKTSISNFFSKALSYKENTKPVPKQNVVVDAKKPNNKKRGEPTMPVLPIRYTIQTERAIYRLSHFKLNNPKRPLHQQVTISNMMYWYLSVSERELYQNYVNQRQPISKQATFAPPPGAHQSSNFMTPSTTPTRSTSPPLPFITAKNTKKKYKPVRNTDYSPNK